MSDEQLQEEICVAEAYERTRVTFGCESCGKQFSVPIKDAGKIERCHLCGSSEIYRI